MGKGLLNPFHSETRHDNVVDHRPLAHGGGVKVILHPLGDLVILEVNPGSLARSSVQSLCIHRKGGGRFCIPLQQMASRVIGQCLPHGPEIRAFQDRDSELVLA